MADQIAHLHKVEVAQGKRFEFGKNWRRFLGTLDDNKINQAEQSLKDFLGQDRLEGLTFLDIGSGSGLFSLAARRLGASVHSFDYDTDSVACTHELRRRYYHDDTNWIVQQGSVLDEVFLSELGQFDIVYSWGVLHHTGKMWEALDAAKPLVAPNGRLFIAIYNDLGVITNEWLRIKQRYNALPPMKRTAFALKIIARDEIPELRTHWRQKNLGGYWRRWSDYSRQSARGMNKWHDWIDWIGGLPYECATVEAVLDFFMKDGFDVERVNHLVGGYGCNEFLFRRVGDIGVQIDHPLPESRFYARRYGIRLSEIGPGGSTGQVNSPIARETDERLYLFDDLRLLGEAHANGRSVSWDKLVSGVSPTRLAPGNALRLERPFRAERGHMWSVSLPDLEGVADSPEGATRSTLALFVDGNQLLSAHALHEEIASKGDGRYSHWKDRLYFSLPNNADPNIGESSLMIMWRTKD